MSTTQWMTTAALAGGLMLVMPAGATAQPDAGDAAAAYAAEGIHAPDAAFSADVWQGQGQGRGNEDRGNGQGNAGRGNDDRGNAQGNSGRGNDDRGNAQANPNRGGANAPAARGNSGNAAPGRSGEARGRNRTRVNPAALRAEVQRMPAGLRRYADSTRRDERLVGLALARASLRGTNADRFKVDSDGSRIRVLNSRDAVLIDMSEQRARELGHWEMRRLGDRTPTEGSPAFCRSGEGHPVWGREWCLDKGFGLGVRERSIWSRASVDDVVFERRPETRATLDRGGLIDVLGDIVFGRLAVQSLALGYDEPLAGRWVQSADEPDAPWLLRVHAGDDAVAEFVDTDRDNEVDILYVIQPRW